MVMVMPYGRMFRPDIRAVVPCAAWKKNGKMYDWLVIDICKRKLNKQLTMMVRFLMLWWGMSALFCQFMSNTGLMDGSSNSPFLLNNLQSDKEHNEKAEPEETAPYPGLRPGIDDTAPLQHKQ